MPKKPTKKSPKTRKPKHVPSYVALGGHSDAYKCSCGWQSNGYWDLVEAAWEEWLVHAFDTGTPIEEKDKKRQAWALQAREDHQRMRRNLSREYARGFVGSAAIGKSGK